MAEYWKSTPKYWCKFCKLFVKDTKLERQQHDATPRHQNNIQRSLRTLHREKEQEDREQQRAKNEVARLNKLAGEGSSGAGGTSSAGSSAPKTPSAPQTQQKASLEDRKRQMQQLADMGVEIPEEFRKEMAIAGSWQTLKVTPVEAPPVDPDSKEAAAFGVRKRKFEDKEEEEALLGTGDSAPRQKHWGSRMKTFPGSKKAVDDDLDALLGGVVVKKDMTKDEEEKDDDVVKDEPLEREIKRADSEEEKEVEEKLKAMMEEKPLKVEEPAEKAAEVPGAGIVFKKRKKIAK